jgi:hypothetical protein
LDKKFDMNRDCRYGSIHQARDLEAHPMFVRVVATQKAALAMRGQPNAIQYDGSGIIICVRFLEFT